MNNYGLLTNNTCNVNRLGSAKTTQEIKTKDVSFTGLPAKPTAYMETTYKRALNLHKKYRESLGETSLRNIIEAVNNIESTTEFSRKTILTAMQKLTQFANMRSIRIIPETLSRHQVSSIGDSAFSNYKIYANATGKKNIVGQAAREAIFDDIGLHNTLGYLIEKKGFGSLSRYKKHSRTGVFLDENKLAQFERFQKENPKAFRKYVSSPNLKLFLISGWDTGISIADKTKNLETETRKLLELAKKENVSIEEAIDLPLMKRIKKLGLNPTVIRTEGMASESCVYRQMAPEKMSENEFLSLIDSNSQIRSKDNVVNRYAHKDRSIQYLENDMKIYTPETLAKSIKMMHGKILDFASKRNIKPEDIIYVEPKRRKSFCIINYLYEKINHIPHERFVHTSALRDNKLDLEGKLLVFLDDCTITGDSVCDLAYEINCIRSDKLKKTPKLFSCVCGTVDAEKRFKRKNDFNLIIQDWLNFEPTTKSHLVDRTLEKSVGCSSFTGGDATCLVFPYMSPDNNTELGSGIALLHNALYRARALDKEGQIRHMGIKNYSDNVNDIAKLYNSLIGHLPQKTDKTLETIIEENPLSFKDKFKEFINELLK